MADGEFLGYETAHGETDDVGWSDVQMIEKFHGVIGHIADAVVQSRNDAASSPPIVENDDLKMLREVMQYGEPALAVATETCNH